MKKQQNFQGGRIQDHTWFLSNVKISHIVTCIIKVSALFLYSASIIILDPPLFVLLD